MDILILFTLSLAVLITGFSIAFSPKQTSAIRIISGVLGMFFLVFTLYIVDEWNKALGYDSLNFELVDKLPFEWNKAHQSYFFYHNGKWKASEQFVDHFDQSMVNSNPDYDSCYIYQVELSKIMKYFDTRLWTPNYEYRQSEDILLLSREKRTIEIK